MSTIEQTVSMMQAMSEESRVKVLDYVKLIYTVDATPNPYIPLSSDEILAELAVGREQNDSGMGIPFDEAMREIGVENGYV
ncbi:MAG: hypothetical protein LUG23_03705 [Oscillospiraceae bacterium]|nr:hypothetical protein [Oscillospiraceae bacterium]